MNYLLFLLVFFCFNTAFSDNDIFIFKKPEVTYINQSDLIDSTDNFKYLSPDLSEFFVRTAYNTSQRDRLLKAKMNRDIYITNNKIEFFPNHTNSVLSCKKIQDITTLVGSPDYLFSCKVYDLLTAKSMIDRNISDGYGDQYTATLNSHAHIYNYEDYAEVSSFSFYKNLNLSDCIQQIHEGHLGNNKQIKDEMYFNTFAETYFETSPLILKTSVVLDNKPRIGILLESVSIYDPATSRNSAHCEYIN